MSPDQDDEQSLPVESKREQIATILQSELFRGAPRLCKMLQYIAAETIVGRGDSLKEYNIATNALGLPSTFDPKTTTLVRTQAKNLRDKLKAYYDDKGRHDPILVDIPKGQYAVTFRAQGSGEQVVFKIVLTGTIKCEDKALLDAIAEHLKKVAKDICLTILKCEPGSIRLFVQCSRTGYERLTAMHNSGLLPDVYGFAVETLDASDAVTQALFPLQQNSSINRQTARRKDTPRGPSALRGNSEVQEDRTAVTDVAVAGAGSYMGIITAVPSVEAARALPVGSIVGDTCGGYSFTDAIAEVLEQRSFGGWREVQDGRTSWTIIHIAR